MEQFQEVFYGRGAWLGLTFAIAFGACLGSFFNVVVWRLPRGESLSHPPSRCPACSHPIRPWHNLPVFGWLILGGRCYDCKQAFSPRYALIEAAFAVVFGLIGMLGCRLGLPIELVLIHFLLISFLYGAAAIDIAHRRLPDKLNLSCGLLALAAFCAVPTAFLNPGEAYAGMPRPLLFSSLASSPLASYLAEAASAVVLGASFLLLSRWLINRYAGHQEHPFPTGQKLHLDAAGARLEGDEALPWKDLQGLQFQIADDAAPLRGQVSCRDGFLIHAEGKVDVGTLTPMTVNIHALSLPREALGLGDAKFAAALGPFLGFPLLFASLFIAVFTALGHALIMRFCGRRDYAVPFGLHLALAAALWALAWPWLLTALGHLIGNLS
jgi:prepilin signal peptidase PulO-like enzyme (type II secretory pathway)